jgi:hypothetical protein
MNLVRLCLTSTALLLTTSPSLAEEVLGTWLRDNGALQVKFEPVAMPSAATSCG